MWREDDHHKSIQMTTVTTIATMTARWKWCRCRRWRTSPPFFCKRTCRSPSNLSQHNLPVFAPTQGQLPLLLPHTMSKPWNGHLLVCWFSQYVLLHSRRPKLCVELRETNNLQTHEIASHWWVDFLRMFFSTLRPKLCVELREINNWKNHATVRLHLVGATLKQMILASISRQRWPYKNIMIFSQQPQISRTSAQSLMNATRLLLLFLSN